jgi:hypothetical protein
MGLVGDGLCKDMGSSDHEQSRVYYVSVYFSEGFRGAYRIPTLPIYSMYTTFEYGLSDVDSGK